jgi:hypothetical protein
MDVGTGNYFYGCRSWQNSDDGWDGYLRGTDSITTTLENCWCFKNGYLEDGSESAGNGNGFKMGGSDDKDLQHNFILKNCLSFQNRVKGYDQNNNKGSMTLYNCTAYNNGTNYKINSSLASGKTLTVINCVSAGTGSVSLLSTAVQATDRWMSPFSVSDTDCLSIDPSGAYGARNSDGSLPEITFMHLASTSDLVNAGTDVGITYVGSKPDLGCFESSYGDLTAETPVTTSIEDISFTNYPNPSSASTTISFHLPKAEFVVISIYNLQGSLVRNITSQKYAAGVHTITFDKNSLSPGIYTCKMGVHKKTYVQKMVVE